MVHFHQEIPKKDEMSDVEREEGNNHEDTSATQQTNKFYLSPSKPRKVLTGRPLNLAGKAQKVHTQYFD